MSDTNELPTFILQAPKDFWWEVKIPVPTDSDYRFAKLDVLFLALDQVELDKLEGKGLADGERVLTDDQVVHRVVRGWRHLPDETGQPVPFGTDALKQLLRVPMARQAIVATYMAASKGLAARKNA